MNNEKMNQMIDEAYKNYKTKTEIMMGHGFHGTLLSQEEFINKCKTNPEFSERWGLRIEERELSLEEKAMWLQNNKDYDLIVGNLDHDHIREVVENEAPAKLITITYNNEIIESYE